MEGFLPNADCILQRFSVTIPLMSSSDKTIEYITSPKGLQAFGTETHLGTIMDLSGNLGGLTRPISIKSLFIPKHQQTNGTKRGWETPSVEDGPELFCRVKNDWSKLIVDYLNR